MLLKPYRKGRGRPKIKRKKKPEMLFSMWMWEPMNQKTVLPYTTYSVIFRQGCQAKTSPASQKERKNGECLSVDGLDHLIFFFPFIPDDSSVETAKSKMTSFPSFKLNNTV
jgi:hypothetical protein